MTVEVRVRRHNVCNLIDISYLYKDEIRKDNPWLTFNTKNLSFWTLANVPFLGEIFLKIPNEIWTVWRLADYPLDSIKEYFEGELRKVT